MTTAMTAAACVTPRPSLIDRLLGRWFAVPAPTGAEADAAARAECREDLRSALEAASMCQVSALSAEYAHYLMDRSSGHVGERG